jgi:hypothetical protein
VKFSDVAPKRSYATAGCLTLMGIFAMRWNVVIGEQLFSKSFLDIDQPISIRALKRFVCEQLGSDTRQDAGRELFPYLKSKTESRQCDDLDELSHLLELLVNADFPNPTGWRRFSAGCGAG